MCDPEVIACTIASTIFQLTRSGASSSESAHRTRPRLAPALAGEYRQLLAHARRDTIVAGFHADAIDELLVTWGFVDRIPRTLIHCFFTALRRYYGARVS